MGETVVEVTRTERSGLECGSRDSESWGFVELKMYLSLDLKCR